MQYELSSESDNGIFAHIFALSLSRSLFLSLSHSFFLSLSIFLSLPFHKHKQLKLQKLLCFDSKHDFFRSKAL